MPRHFQSIALTLAVMLALPPRGTWSAEVTSIPVSLIVQESCEIRSDDASDILARPLVSCLHGQPFAVEQTVPDPVTVSTEAKLVRKVWMVGF
jgi:hypothetical protein